MQEAAVITEARPSLDEFQAMLDEGVSSPSTGAVPATRSSRGSARHPVSTRQPFRTWPTIRR